MLFDDTSPETPKHVWHYFRIVFNKTLWVFNENNLELMQPSLSHGITLRYLIHYFKNGLLRLAHAAGLRIHWHIPLKPQHSLREDPRWWVVCRISSRFSEALDRLQWTLQKTTDAQTKEPFALCASAVRTVPCTLYSCVPVSLRFRRFQVSQRSYYELRCMCRPLQWSRL